MTVPNSIERNDAAPPEPASDSSRVAPKFPKIVSFNDLCRCGEEVWIENDGQVYRLRRTRQGKLILTK